MYNKEYSVKKLLFVCCLIPTLAYAQQVDTVTLSLTLPEQQALIQLLDTAVKSCGLQCAANAILLAQKIQAAAPTK